eukprot:CAMPEP_0179615912 /NCGR_PEP_ID=MMETSP0930-20121108/6343_1 /TAXON_ID=548131 ORGANISM="Ostreococcus mediterraneus, Strain clade-D-RCC1621" /NCGR_SAMPLE_ID=MMETSP0930 /ASSEMBLY_ACC=CAM_ASM_000580 /LENGTH=115 /DNA_ID=CAMNT_0021484711 /DNA_START=9 /DNA_END=356 /DNA_ORIENTATION=+
MECGVANGKCGEFSRRSIAVAASFDELLERLEFTEFVVKVGVVSTHIAEGITRPRAHVRIWMIEKFCDYLRHISIVNDRVVPCAHASELGQGDKPVDDDLRVVPRLEHSSAQRGV